MSEKTEKEEHKYPLVKLIIRIIQAIFIGCSALGLSLMLGDITPLYVAVISPMSVSTTVYGLLGALVCEIAERKVP